MKLLPAFSLSVAALSIVAFGPASTSYAQNSCQPAMGSQMSSPRGEHEAMRMVPARAALDGNLVASKVKPGDMFRARLANKVQLSNGPTLPAGTLLIGQISTDDMSEAGTSKLALRFTEAKLKNGQTIPIKATIVGIMDNGYANEDNYRMNPGDQVPNSWNDGTLTVDQLGALHDVDLHSKIASKNSGVFVSSKNDNMKLKDGSELLLAIAQQQHPMDPMNTTGTMNTPGNQ